MDNTDSRRAPASALSAASPSASPRHTTGPRLERAASDDFESIGPSGWRGRVEEELGPRPFETLVAETLDGLRIEPLYTPADMARATMPGRPPYRRGGRLAGGATPWRITQEVGEIRPLSPDLDFGATALWWRFDRAVRLGRPATETDDDTGDDGLPLHTVDDLLVQLDGVDLGRVWCVLDAGSAAPVAAALWLAAARRRGVAWERLEGCWGHDPLAALARDGGLSSSLEAQWRRMADLASWSARETPGMRSILVSTRPYHDAGAPPVDEVAFAIATAIDYLRHLATTGLDVDTVARQMVFSLSIGRDLFPEIAKLRALRLLWTGVVERAGAPAEAAAMVLHARTSAATLTTREPWLNLLRVAAEGFAAVVGGVDALTLSPYDEALGTSGDATRRHALQAHHLLAEEAHLGRVADPAGGSWAVESLTDQLARAAWARVREIEGVGGMAAYLLSGALGQALEHRAHQRRERLGRRAEAIVGVSEFPNLAADDGEATQAHQEPRPITATTDDGHFPPPRAAACLEELAALLEGGGGEPGQLMAALVAAAEAGASAADLAERLAAASVSETEPGERGALIEPLPLRRWAAPFEDLRAACDHWSANHGRPPRVVLANLGTQAEFGPRTDFSANLFAAGGIEALRGTGGDSVEAIANEAMTHLASGHADGVVICGPDAHYRTMAAELASSLKSKGARWLFLAGRPGEEETTYRDAGIDTFIFLGCDVLAVLEAFLGDLEVIR